MVKRLNTYTGTVKWFDNRKGYGFIYCEAHPAIFIHRSAIEKADTPLKSGDIVTFSVIEAVTGLHARTVVKDDSK